MICINVREQIEDDAAAARKMLSFLKPGGKLLLYVPACQWAYGSMDRNMGHHRRYSRRDLRRLAREAGAGILKCRAVNFVGLLGWYCSGRGPNE